MFYMLYVCIIYYVAFKGNDNFNRRNSEFDKKTRKNRNSIENFSGNMMESDKGIILL